MTIKRMFFNCIFIGFILGYITRDLMFMYARFQEALR
jgi:hypothetical protein